MLRHYGAPYNMQSVGPVFPRYVRMQKKLTKATVQSVGPTLPGYRLNDAYRSEFYPRISPNGVNTDDCAVGNQVVTPGRQAAEAVRSTSGPAAYENRDPWPDQQNGSP